MGPSNFYLVFGMYSNVGFLNITRCYINHRAPLVFPNGDCTGREDAVIFYQWESQSPALAKIEFEITSSCAVPMFAMRQIPSFHKLITE